jgi:hypothetical protein
MHDSKKRAPFVLSAEMSALMDRLKAMRPGELAPVAELGASRQEIYRAAEMLRRDGSGVWKQERGHVRRFTSGEVVDLAAPRYLRRAAGAARRGKESLVLVEYSELTAEQQRKHNVSLGVLGACSLTMSTKAQNLVGRAVSESNVALPAMSLMEMFTKKLA